MAIAGLAVAAGSSTGVTTTNARVSEDRVTKIEAVSTSTSFHVVTKSGKTFPSEPGDMVLGTDMLVSGTHTIGTDQFACVLVEGTRQECSQTLFLKKGVLIFQTGVENDEADTYSFAIVGGTGAYKNARGQLTSKAINDTTERVTIEIIM